MAYIFKYGDRYGKTSTGKILGSSSVNLVFQTSGPAFLNWYYIENNPTAPATITSPNGFLYFRSLIPNSALINYGDGTVENHQFYYNGGYYYLAFSSQIGSAPHQLISNWNPIENHVFTDGFSGKRGVSIKIANPIGVDTVYSNVVLLYDTYPSEVGLLNNLNTLRIRYAKHLTQFPLYISKLDKLKVLSLALVSQLPLTEYPQTFLGFTNLSYLEISFCFDFSDLDTSKARTIANYGPILETLLVQGCNMNDIPIEWTSLTSLTGIAIGGNKWVQPPSNLNLLSPTITSLNLGGTITSLMTGYGDFSNLININYLGVSVIPNLTTSLPSYLNVFTNLKTFIAAAGTFGTQDRIDTFISNFYDFIVMNALIESGNTQFRQMKVTTHNPNSTVDIVPTGIYQQPLDYVQGTSNGTPSSPMEKVWVMVNQYAHIWTVQP